MTNPYPGNTHWPSNFQGCTLTATYVGLDGSVIAGSISLSARPAVLQDYSAFKIIVPRGLEIPLVAGAMSIVVPATDDPDVNPTDWTYSVTENFPGGRSYNIDAPMNTTVDLVNAAPVASAGGNAIVRGNDGRGVVGVALDGSFHLIVTFTDATTQDAGNVSSLISFDGGTDF